MPSPQTLHSAAAAVAVQSATAGATAEDCVQRASECLRFITGEWLINESWRDSTPGSRHSPRVRHRLYFQRSATAPCEAMGEIAAGDACHAAAAPLPPLLFRSGERCAIVFGHTVFQRWQGQQGPYWHRVTMQPFGAAAFFLRRYLKQMDADALSAHGLSLPEIPYDFGHLDLERNVLVTCRRQADPRVPQFLVYSAPDYGLAWQFDAGRTRRVNGMR